MPRCNCSDQRCACIVQGGTGVTVTGTGTQGDPYLVEAASSGGGGGGDVSAGDVKWTAAAFPPAGWLIADGAAVSRTTYATLFDAIGTRFGVGNGATTFNLPDLTGRFALGADQQYPMGSGGGSSEKTLTTDQMPSHTHSLNNHSHSGTTASAGVHEHNAGTSTENGQNRSNVRTGGTEGRQRNDELVDTSGAHTHSFTTGQAGGGYTGGTGSNQPFNVMPPYTALTPLIRT